MVLCAKCQCSRAIFGDLCASCLSTILRHYKSRITTLESKLKRCRTALEDIVVCDSRKSVDPENRLEYAVDLCKHLAREALKEMDDG